ncbi:MAG TPA: MFS transporter, partial [Polyangiaceae bacterium]|nr:MFS transporter [Polyangiaceae bacterium]
YSEAQNLWLAFGTGSTYVIGALASHSLCERLGERRVALVSVALLLSLHVLLTLLQSPRLIAVVFPLIGLLQAIKWPIVESYVSAGRSPSALVGLLGRYNVSWALAIPLALAISGAIIGSGAQSYFFLIPAVLNVATLVLIARWPDRRGRFEHDHPDRPPERTLSQYAALVVSARWTMVASYFLLFLLAPLMPGIFGRLALDVRHAAFASSLLDVLRLITFALLGLLPAWHGRSWPLLLTSVALPASFFMVLFGRSLALVLLGEAIFGVASGFAYCAALYYAVIVKNASVDAGGVHEGLIGVGFAIGPLAGLLGHALALPLGGYVISMLTAVTPLVIVATCGAFWPLRRAVS